MTTSATPSRFRASVSFNSEGSRVHRKGGKYGRGYIEGVSVTTRGEALGHDLWCDAQFLADVSSQINNLPNGLKARFTHPGLSADGVGTKLGKFTDARVEGDQVLADLHFQEAAFNTPDGDLGSYVLSIAQDTPEDFGLSIVFDYVETSEVEDSDNLEEYDIPVLHRLYACDVVDSPAANPNGLFKRGQDAAMQADELLKYALGLTDSKPELSEFNVDADRAKQFIARFLASQELSIGKVEQMAEEIQTPEVSPEPQASREDFSNELSRYVEAFGAENGVKWFQAGISFEDCQDQHIEALQSELETLKADTDKRVEELTAQLSEANEKLAQLNLGEDDGVEFNAPKTDEKKGFASNIRIVGRN